MFRGLLHLPFAAALALLAAAALAGGGYWVAIAAAVYFSSYLNKGNVRRVLPAVILLALSALSVWGALLSACFLLALLLTETWLAGSRVFQISRLLAAVLGLKVVLLALIPEISPYLETSVSHVALTITLAVTAVIAGVVADDRAAPRIDPLLSSFLTMALLCYFLSIALLSATTIYIQAVLLATLGLSVVLTVVVLLTAPFTGGNASLDSIQHVFSLRVPIEEWAARISALAADINTSAEFVEAVARELSSLPGVVGASCRLDDGNECDAGGRSRQTLKIYCSPLWVKLYTRRRASPWEWFNYYLPVRVAAEFCRVKQREERHRADNLSRAVHETGARLTHDIKNILHALAALTQGASDALIKRQLPVLRERLETALRKLQTPAAVDDTVVVAADWWGQVQQRYQHQRVVFVAASLPLAASLPPALFDLALDNFIGNALAKRQTASSLTVTASLTAADGGIALRVADDGAAVVATTARQLFLLPVESQTGFGVALYQVGVEAGKMGYAAELESNVAGNVVFCLRSGGRGG